MASLSGLSEGLGLSGESLNNDQLWFFGFAFLFVVIIVPLLGLILWLTGVGTPPSRSSQPTTSIDAWREDWWTGHPSTHEPPTGTPDEPSQKHGVDRG